MSYDFIVGQNFANFAIGSVIHAIVHVAGHEVYHKTKPRSLRGLMRNHDVQRALNQSYLAALLLLKDELATKHPELKTQAGKAIKTLKSKAFEVFPLDRSVDPAEDLQERITDNAPGEKLDLSRIIAWIPDAPDELKRSIEASFGLAFSYAFREIGLKRSEEVRAVIMHELLSDVRGKVTDVSGDMSALRLSVDQIVSSLNERDAEMDRDMTKRQVALDSHIDRLSDRLKEVLTTTRDLRQSLAGSGPVRGYLLVCDEHGTPLMREPVHAPHVTVGRGGAAQVKLPDPEVSATHLRISFTPSAMEVRDLGSTNGTVVSGKRISKVTMIDFGESVSLGRHQVRIISPDQGQAERSSALTRVSGQTVPPKTRGDHPEPV